MKVASSIMSQELRTKFSFIFQYSFLMEFFRIIYVSQLYVIILLSEILNYNDSINLYVNFNVFIARATSSHKMSIHNIIVVQLISIITLLKLTDCRIHRYLYIRAIRWYPLVVLVSISCPGVH